MKSEPEANNLTPVNLTDLSSNAPSQIPEWAASLVGNTPNETIEKIISFLAPNDADASLIFRGFFSGLPIFNVDVPAWVKLASEKTFESSGLEFVSELKPGVDPSVLLEVLGKATRLLEVMLTNSISEVTPLNNDQSTILAPMSEGLKQLASKSTPEQAAAFYNARNDAKKIVEKLAQPTVRAKIYASIMMNWSEIERLKNAGELKSTNDLHRWLLVPENSNCRLVIPSNTDSREIRKACETIGLSFENQWRKPQSENLGQE